MKCLRHLALFWRAVFVFAVALFAGSLQAQQRPHASTQLLDSASLREKAAQLLQQARNAPDGVAFVNLVERPDSLLQLCVRVKSGRAEWHRDDADLLIMQQGEAEVVTGGKVVGGAETAPGEIRGDSIQGGSSRPFHAGDAIRIEPQTPHQFLLKPGAVVIYLAVKTHPLR